MKKVLKFVLFFVCFGVSAQNLSLNDLIALRKMDMDQVEVYLTNKGWRYKDGNAPSKGKMGVANFVFSSTGEIKYGQSFIAFLYAEDGTQRLKIQIHDQDKYLEYLAGVKKFSPSPIKTTMIDGDLIKVYVGKTTTFEFATSTRVSRSGNTSSMWLLFIVENNDYATELAYQ